MEKKKFFKEFSGVSIKLSKKLSVKLSIKTEGGLASSCTSTTTHISERMKVVFNGDGSSEGDQIELGVAGIGVGGKSRIIISCTWQELLAAI